MNFGKDIAQGLSRSFQQVGQQLPQQIHEQRENERTRMQQMALQDMRQRQQEAQHAAEMKYREAHDRQQQANIDRTFQAQQEQQKLSNAFNREKFDFEQGKFVNPEQKLLDKENLEKERIIKGIYGASNVSNLSSLNNPEFSKKANNIISKGSSEIADFKNRVFGTNFITNNISKELSNEIKSKYDIFYPGNRDSFLRSGLFDDLAKKEGYRTAKEKENFKSEINSYLEQGYTKADAIKELVNTEFPNVSKNDFTQKKLFDNALAAVASDNPKESIRRLLKEYTGGKFKPGEIDSLLNQIENEANQFNQQSQPQINSLEQNNQQQSPEEDIEGQLLNQVEEERYPSEKHNQIENPQEQIKQRNEILNKNVDQEIKNEINKNVAFTSHMLGVSLTPEQMKQSSLQFSVAAEPIRKITQGIANLLDYDPEILKQAEAVGTFEKENGLTSFLLQLPAQAFLIAGGEKTLGTLAELAKKGITENFIARTASNAIANGGISKLSNEEFTEGALGSIGGDILGTGLSKGLNIAKAGKEGFKEGGIKGAGKAAFEEAKPNILSKNINEKSADIAEQQGKKLLEENTKSLNKDLESRANKIAGEEIKPIIENNVNLKENLDEKTVKGFQEKGEEYYEKAKENYNKSKEFNRTLDDAEKTEFKNEVTNVSDKIREKPTDEIAEKGIKQTEKLLSNINSSDDAIDAIQYLNKHFAKSENSFYQEIAKKYKPVIENLISKIDGGYYKEANKYYTNLKQFEKQLKTDNIVNDSFKFAEDLSELGSKDLQAIKSLNDLYSNPLSKLLKKPNVQNFDLTTAKGIEGTIEKSIKDLHSNLDNQEKLIKSFENFDKEFSALKYQISKHPELETKYENIHQGIKKHIDTFGEINIAKQLNDKTVKEFATTATEDIIKNPKKIIDKITEGNKNEFIKLIKDWIPKNWENVFESLSSPVETISKFFARKDVDKKLNEILNHHIKQEKFAKKLIAEDLGKDLEKLVKDYRNKTNKSEKESTDKLKTLLGKISRTSILTYDRGEQ